MRALPIAALLLLAACANGGSRGQADIPGVNVAEAALRGGSPQVAMRIDDAILARDSRNVAALLNRGDAQTALQQSDAAAQSYAEALRADPDSIPARIGLGRLRLADDPAAAETLFAEVVQRAPRNAVALNDLGIARDLLGRHQEAQAAYRQTIGIDPSMSGARVNLALSLAMAGRADDAAPMLRPLANAPNAPRRLRHDLAAVLAMGGDRSQAQRILAQDLPPDQVNQALAIFTAASAPSGPGPATGAPAPLSGAPANSAPTHGPVTHGAAIGEPPDAGSLTGDPVVQLSSTASSDAAPAEWRRLQKRMPDLLVDRQPIVVRLEAPGRTQWGVRTAGFAGLGEAKAFCDAVKARGAACYVIGS